MKRLFLLFALPFFLLSCELKKQEPPPLMIDTILSSKDLIDPAKPLPEFTLYFATGTTVVNSYVSLRNFEAMTGSYVVRMRWHYPNDFRPPMAQRVVTLNAGQNVAQFSLHDEKGLQIGPYLLDARAGKDEMTLTASGSARFFVGMSEEEAKTYLEDEAEYKRKYEEERAKREAEQKKADEERRALEEKLSWEKRLLGSGAVKEGFSSSDDTLSSPKGGGVEKEKKAELPPSLVGGE